MLATGVKNSEEFFFYVKQQEDEKCIVYRIIILAPFRNGL